MFEFYGQKISLKNSVVFYIAQSWASAMSKIEFLGTKYCMHAGWRHDNCIGKVTACLCGADKTIK